MMQQTSGQRTSTSYISKKFNFKNHELAYQVRATVYDALKSFDENGNGLLEQKQLREAMIQILGQNQSEVHYSVKNMMRYDKNNDGLVTFDQFTNFSVEQHFGELAIQRLHRKGFYSKGTQRIMNLQEFINTLKYCLGFINIVKDHSIYQDLFREVDLNHDGYISYQEYFMFLREYFGSKSQAFQTISMQQKSIPVPPPKVTVTVPSPKVAKTYPKGESPQQRLAALIFSQLRVSILETNQKDILQYSRRQIENMLSQILRIGSHEHSKFFTRQQTQYSNGQMGLDRVLKQMVIFYICEYDALKNIKESNMSSSEFARNLQRGCGFLQIKPSKNLLDQLFEEITKNESRLCQSKYIEALKDILNNYNFDRRGRKIV